MSSGGLRGAEKSDVSTMVDNDECELLLILQSDEVDFSAPWRPPEVILGSMGSEHTIYVSL